MLRGVSFFDPPEDDLPVLALPRTQLVALFNFRRWILETARAIPDTSSIVSGVGERFVACGLDLGQLTTAVEVRHSERAAVGRRWEPGSEAVEFFFPHGPVGAAIYDSSPF